MSEPTIGHNSMTTATKEYLRSVVDRLERLESDHKDTLKDFFFEAKANGLDVKTIRKVVALRKKDAQKREEEQALLELYLDAIRGL